MLGPVGSPVLGAPLHFPVIGCLLVFDSYKHLVAHVGKGLHEVPVQILEHMEAVERDPGIGECRLSYQLHAVGEVHAYVKHSPAFLLGNLQQPPEHRSGLYACNDGDDCAPSAMGILVGYEGIEPAAVHRLVYRQMPAHILGCQNPLLGMSLLVPVLIAAEMILVHLTQIVAVDTVAATDGTGGHRTVV